MTAAKVQLHENERDSAGKKEKIFIRNPLGKKQEKAAKNEWALSLYTLFCVQIDE